MSGFTVGGFSVPVGGTGLTGVAGGLPGAPGAAGVLGLPGVAGAVGFAGRVQRVIFVRCQATRRRRRSPAVRRTLVVRRWQTRLALPARVMVLSRRAQTRGAALLFVMQVVVVFVLAAVAGGADANAASSAERNATTTALVAVVDVRVCFSMRRRYAPLRSLSFPRRGERSTPPGLPAVVTRADPVVPGGMRKCATLRGFGEVLTAYRARTMRRSSRAFGAALVTTSIAVVGFAPSAANAATKITTTKATVSVGKATTSGNLVCRKVTFKITATVTGSPQIVLVAGIDIGQAELRKTSKKGVWRTPGILLLANSQDGKTCARAGTRKTLGDGYLVTAGTLKRQSAKRTVKGVSFTY